MVPVNFHQWKQDIRQALLVKAEAIASEWDPFVAAWVCYALSIDGIENNQPLLNLLDRMRRWLEEEAWSYERDLGPIALSLWLLGKRGENLPSEFTERFVERVCALNADEKLSLLRDPEQVFLLSLGIAAKDNESAKVHLIKISREQMRLGPLKRRILYAAALKELSQDVAAPNADPADEGDIVSLVWWAEKYQGNKHEAWDRFSSVTERIALEPEGDSDAQRILSAPEIAMLYEAVFQESKHPEPALLFDYFPFHPRLWSVARDHFMNGKYSSAVFQGVLALFEMIRDFSGVANKDGAALVKETMGVFHDEKKEITKPTICFNNFLNQDSGQSEQRGLAALYWGVYKAFRNPKGHKPEDHSLVQLDAYEALHQLIIVNYLMVRVERAIQERERYDRE